MNLVKSDPLEAGITIATDKHGYEYVVAVAKGTFTIERDGKCTLAEQQQPLIYEDAYYSEPGLSSVQYESDFALRKPKTDVILNGSAYAPRGKSAHSVDVILEISTIRKSIRVIGDRVWRRSLLGGFHQSRPKPFLSIPIVYERAYGGTDTNHKNKKKHAYETANLVGVGFHKYLHKGIEGTHLPNLGYPKKLISRPTDKSRPIGFGFISRNWHPRVSYAGTYDQKWLDERYPFLPLDFDDRYFQGAPEDQTCKYLRGGEKVRLSNLTPEGLLEFNLPSTTVIAILEYKSHQETLSTILDTVIIEPDERRVILTWRASSRLKDKPTNLYEVWIGNPDWAQQQTNVIENKNTTNVQTLS